MPTPTNVWRELVGKRVMIERDGVTHKGVLMGEVFRHVRGAKVAQKRWVLLDETYFKANDGWTVTPLRPARSSKAQPDGLPSSLRADHYFDRAWEFKKAYLVLTEALPKAPPPSWPRYLLLSYSIELALKAFLAAHGRSAWELQSFRHDLTTLLKEAVNCGLTLEPKAHEDIKLLRKAHEHHWARYPKEDGDRVIVIEEFEQTACEVLQQVGKALSHDGLVPDAGGPTG